MEAALDLNQLEESRPSFDVVITTPGATVSESTVRAIARKHRVKLFSIAKRTPQRAHLRLATASVYDIVVAFEAVGMEVVRVVASAR